MQQPIIDAVGTTSGIVKANQGNLDQLAGDIRGQLPQLQQMAFGPNPSLNAANGYAQDVLGGKYLNQGNPYMSAMLGQTRENVGNQVNSTFSMAGRTGGGNHVERLGQGLATAENNLRYQDYASERERMAQQAALVPGLTAAQYAGIEPWLQTAQTAGGLPYAGVGALSPIIGLAGGSGTTTSTQPGGWGTSLLGALSNMIQISPIKVSDRRLKTKIKLLHRDPDGLGHYEFAYKRAPDVMLKGVMADEVKTLRPAAYVPNWRGDGFDAVNYGAL